jgi:histo-blood group ABO system transferase
MKICILNIATNKYIQFVEQLLNSVEENFLNGHEISALVFTNHEIEEISENVKISQIDHEPWPIPTLKRYHYFLKEKEYISQFDYCFYMDVDMRIVDKVGEEVFGDLVATQHPGMYFKSPDECTYERREQSTAYVPYGEGKMYYAGGFNGGKPEHFLKMSETIVENVEKDFENNLIAVWHDESHMNRYLINNPPTLELTPSYCYPEGATQDGSPSKYYPLGWKVPFDPKIMALQKSHAEIRN